MVELVLEARFKHAKRESERLSLPALLLRWVVASGLEGRLRPAAS